MKRRSLLASAAASIALPAVVRAQGTPGATQLLKFIPQSDLVVLDPHWTTAYVTRNHAFMVFDTLYGVDGQYRASPQMAAGHTVENDGRLWRLTLRDGLQFHDGTPVLARDCVASVKRWGKRDAFGQSLLAATDELSADGDRVIVFRLKRPFPLLPDALGKNTTYMPAIMPERLANTDAMTQVQEMVGSGPFRFVPGERFRGRWPSTPSSTATSRARVARPIGPPGRRWCISTAWSGTPRPTRRPPRPPCKAARRIGGIMPVRTCCRCLSAAPA